MDGSVRRARLYGADDPCDLLRDAPCRWRGACAKAQGAFSRGPPYRHGRVDARGDSPRGPRWSFWNGAFDGTALQATLNKAGWSLRLPHARSTVATWEGTTFRLDTLGACSKPRDPQRVTGGQVYRDAYGPVMVLSCWAKGYQEPLSLVSNMDAAEEACRYESNAFPHRDLFLRPESRGFHMHKSHISDPQRLSRLLIAAC